jgi:hypothetical protein
MCEIGQGRIQYWGADAGLPFLNPQVAQHVSSAFTGGAGAHGDSGTPTYRIFDVTGVCAIQLIFGYCNTSLTSAGAPLLSLGTPASAINIISTSPNVTGFDIGEFWTTTGANAFTDEYLNLFSQGVLTAKTSQGWQVIGNTVINETTTIADITGGQIDYYCIWMPLQSGASIKSSPQDTLS